MKKVNEVIQYFEDLYSCGAIYLWGSNGQIITKELCDSLYQKYGSKTYTKEYYNNKEATDEEIIAASKMAKCHEFITNLKD